MKRFVCNFFLIFFISSLFFSCAQDSVQVEEDNKSLIQGDEVSEEWRDQIDKQFSSNVDFLKSIILQGESDDQLDDFKKLFEKQNLWFDTHLSSTQRFFDPNYNAIMQKKTSLQYVVNAQKKADEILVQEISDDEFDDVMHKKLRLVILYDLNSLIQRQIEKGLANLVPTGIELGVVTKIVHDVLNKFRKQKVINGHVESDVSDEVNKLENEVKKLKKKIKKIKREKKLLAKKSTKKLEQKNKTNLDIEILLEKTKKNMAVLKREEKLRAKVELEDKYRKLLENKNKKNLELQLKLKRLKSKLMNMEKELTFWQNEAKKNVIGKNELSKKMNLNEQINKRRAEVLRQELGG